MKPSVKALVTVMAALLVSCLPSCSVVPSQSSGRGGSSIDEETRMKILAAIFRFTWQSEPNASSTLWIEASDSEFRLLSSVSALTPSGFRLAQFKKGKSSIAEADQIVKIDFMETKSKNAEARISFLGRNHAFATFVYKLIKDEGEWKVLESAFDSAS